MVREIFDEIDMKRMLNSMSREEVLKRLENKHQFTKIDLDMVKDLDEQQLRDVLMVYEPSLEKNLTDEKRAQLSIDKYEEYLKSSNVSDKIKQNMLQNLKQNLNSIEMSKISYGNSGTVGLYYADSKHITIDPLWGIDENNLRDTWAHEMTHAATACDQEMRVGFQSWEDGRGVAINEGTTEYFSNKLIQENNYKYSEEYSMFIPIVEDLIDIYGEEEVINAFVNSPERLEELMAKDR